MLLISFLGALLLVGGAADESLGTEMDALGDQQEQDETQSIEQEQLNDENEDFFKSSDENVDRNRYFFPDTTIKKGGP